MTGIIAPGFALGLTAQTHSALWFILLRGASRQYVNSENHDENAVYVGVFLVHLRSVSRCCSREDLRVTNMGDPSAFGSRARKERIDQLDPHVGYPGRPSSSSRTVIIILSSSLSLKSVLWIPAGIFNIILSLMLTSSAGAFNLGAIDITDSADSLGSQVVVGESKRYKVFDSHLSALAEFAVIVIKEGVAT